MFISRIGTWAARQTLCIGCVVGLMIVAPVTMPTFSTSSASAAGLPCSFALPEAGTSHEVCEEDDLTVYIGVQNDINTANFGSAVEAGSYFLLNTYPTTATAFAGSGLAGGVISLDIMEVVELDVTGASHEGQTARMCSVIGMLTGGAGKIPVSGLVIDIPSAEGPRKNFFLPMSTVNAGEYAHMVSVRPYRDSTPPSIIDGTFDRARIPGANPNCTGGTVQENCVCIKQQAADNCRKNARNVNASCLALVAAGLALALLRCALTATVPGIGWLVAGGCAAWAVVLAALAVNGCTANIMLSLRNCDKVLITDLRGCGINIAES